MPVALLRLLCTWLDNCEPAVEHFLTHSAVLLLVVDILKRVTTEPADVHSAGLAAMLLGTCLLHAPQQLGKDTLLPLLVNNVGISNFCRSLDGLGRDVAFRTAARVRDLPYSKHPIILVGIEEEWHVQLYSRMLTMIWKKITLAIYPRLLLLSGIASESDGESSDVNSAIVEENLRLKEEMWNAQQELTSLQNESTLHADMQSLQVQVKDLTLQLDSANRKLKDISSSQANPAEHILKMAQECTELREQLRDSQDCNKQSVAKIAELESQLVDGTAASHAEPAAQTVETSGDTQTEVLSAELAEAKARIEKLELENSTLRNERISLEEQHSTLKEEHEDLLHMMAEAEDEDE